MKKEVDDTQLDTVIQLAIHHHGNSRDAIIPILSEINETFGYIPGSAFGKIRRLLNTPAEGLFMGDSNIFATASFYQMFSLKPTGKHVIRFCQSAPCHVVGGRKILEAIQEHLQIGMGETTQDEEWTLLPTSCIGICSVGPVIMVDGDLYGNLTAEKIPGILAQYGKNS